MFRNFCSPKTFSRNKATELISAGRICKRLFFNTAVIQERTKVFHQRKLVGFSCEQMYSVVSDVEKYNQFVPFCTKSDILQRSPERLKARLQIGFPPIVESYTSEVTLARPNFVKSVCKDGKIFNHLESTWTFSEALKNNTQSCIIEFHISFRFRSIIHSNLAFLVFDRLVRQMENAFMIEAKRRYGKESIPSKPLDIIKPQR